MSTPQIIFANTPEPPYYAVIFASALTDDPQGYSAMAQTMMDLAREQAGCFGADSVRDAKGLGLTVSYFRDEAAILAWKTNAEHLLAQKLGRENWYQSYSIRVARVERAYSFDKE